MFLFLKLTETLQYKTLLLPKLNTVGTFFLSMASGSILSDHTPHTLVSGLNIIYIMVGRALMPCTDKQAVWQFRQWGNWDIGTIVIQLSVVKSRFRSFLDKKAPE
jgi:hypothetical protein